MSQMRPKNFLECNCRAERRPRCNDVHEVDPRGGPCLEFAKYGTVQNRGKYRVSAYGSSVDVDGPGTPKKGLLDCLMV